MARHHLGDEPGDERSDESADASGDEPGGMPGQVPGGVTGEDPAPAVEGADDSLRPIVADGADASVEPRRHRRP